MANHDETLNRCFAALADPTRRAILERLARGRASVSELAAPHDMALPSFMAHLAKLERAGLVTSAKTGRIRHYSLSDLAFTPARDWLGQQADLWHGRLDRLDSYAETLNQRRTDHEA